MKRSLTNPLTESNFELVSRKDVVEKVRAMRQRGEISVVVDVTPPCIGDEVEILDSEVEADKGIIVKAWFDDEADLFEILAEDGETFYLCEGDMDVIHHKYAVCRGWADHPQTLPSYEKYVRLMNVHPFFGKPWFDMVVPEDDVLVSRRILADAGARIIRVGDDLFVCTEDTPEKVEAFWNALQKIGFVMPKDEQEG